MFSKNDMDIFEEQFFDKVCVEHDGLHVEDVCFLSNLFDQTPMLMPWDQKSVSTSVGRK